MKKFIKFGIRVGKSFAEHNLHVYAGDMTFKLILSIFPLLLFALAVTSFLRIDESSVNAFVQGLVPVFPPDVVTIIDAFISEVITENTFVRSTALLSFSILLALYSASSGFASIIQGINNCYGQKDDRGFIGRRALGILLALMFVGIVALTMFFMVFGSGLLRFLLTVLAIFIIVMLIYKFGSYKKIKARDVLPGTCVTVIGWMLFSYLFNIYVSNFGNFAVIYGSLGGVIVGMIWLNLITLVLLAGAEINAHTRSKKQEVRGKK